MSVSAAAEAGPAREAAELKLGPAAMLLFSARALQYVVYGLTGVILARGLGPDGRGIYGLINETAYMFASFPGLGLEVAGIYLLGQQRYRLQTVFSNSLSWGLLLAAVAVGLIVLALTTDQSLLGMSSKELSVALAGAAIITVTDGASQYLMPMGRVWPYTIANALIPTVRLLGIAVVALAVGLSVGTAAAIWFGSFAVGGVIIVYFLRQHVRLRPGLDLGAMKAQVSFGVRGHFGWILQALNHRLDVFLVSAFVGTAGVGEYLVGVNLAELSWWVPIALGTVLFAKASAMDADSNFEMSAAACRRTLVVTAVASVALLVMARPMIPVVYGTAFAPAASVFVILLPSGMLYTLHKVLSSSLAANGMPQASLYAGLVSLPATVGLNLLLIPAWGIKGAAVASDIAYAINSGVVLFLFVKHSGISLKDTLVFNASDWQALRWSAREVWQTRVRRAPAYQPAGEQTT